MVKRFFLIGFVDILENDDANKKFCQQLQALLEDVSGCWLQLQLQ